MSNFNQESVLGVHHWTDNLFSFTTTRHPSFRFRNGEFTMIGLKVGEKPLLRAYSVASANYEDRLEFFSIKVPDGPLTSRLQHLKEGDEIIVSRKATGTLVIDNLEDGRNLYLIGTGTGLAPFLSVIKDPATYERFEKVVLLHGCRRVAELAYGEMITEKLPNDDLIGELVRNQLIYYPTVTRDPFRNRGRITDLIASGKLFSDAGLAQLAPEHDRVMICGSPALVHDTRVLLSGKGLSKAITASPASSWSRRLLRNAKAPHPTGCDYPAGQTAPVLIQASTSAPACCCVPGAGVRPIRKWYMVPSSGLVAR
jgi:ferredoxin--NADP+ reductase